MKKDIRVRITEELEKTASSSQIICFTSEGLKQARSKLVRLKREYDRQYRFDFLDDYIYNARWYTELTCRIIILKEIMKDWEK